MRKGDFLLVDYTGRVTATHEVFDTTVKEHATHPHGHEKVNYGPVLVILGEGMIVDGVEHKLEGMQEGQQASVTLDPRDAFGIRSPDYIKTMPLSKFHEMKIEPAPGMFVEIAGMAAKVQSVTGGRVRVDFNNPLAGRQVSYDIKLVKHVTDVQEMLNLLLKNLGLESSHSYTEGKLQLAVEKELAENFRKLLSERITKLIPQVKEVVFIVSEKK